jgi:hypothetical protein
MGNIFLENALLYTKLGFFVFPCREKAGKPYTNEKGKIRIPKEKSPYVHSGFKEASVDEQQITEWWNRWKHACIGISCQPSNLFLIDVDVKGGRRGIDNYMKLGIMDNGALHSRTPSKGLHILFSGSGKSSTNTKTGIDTRGEGGYFIAPPSVIIEGAYTGKYVALDEWNRIPVEISREAIEVLDVNNNHEHKSRLDDYSPDKVNTPGTIEKVKKALETLPMEYCDSYQQWITIGLCLYNLGNEGLSLWDNWSRKSSKYEAGVCEDVWERFSPREISLASLFYYAKMNS